jgi:hypothetical protein
MKRFRLVVEGMIAVVVAAGIMVGQARASEPTYQASVDWKKAEMNYIKALSSDNQGVRLSAANHIAIYRLTSANEKLVDVLKNDTVESVRMAAALALITIGDQKGVKAIEEVASADKNTVVAKFCSSLLDASNKQFSMKP